MSKLTTERLELKVRSLGDVDALLSLYSDPEMTRFTGGPCIDRDQIVKSVFVSDTHWRKNGFGLWSIFLLKTNELIGSCGLKKIPPPSTDVELTIHLAKKHWKKGLATEACKAVLKLAFDLHKLPAITANTDPKNLGALKLLEKFQFKKISDTTYKLTK